MFQSEYLNRVYGELEKKDAGKPEFLQAAAAIFGSLDKVIDKHPEWEAAGLIERFVEPERVISFRVPWVDDEGKVRVNRGYRVQYNSAIGPYKGGLRFHPTVNESVMKFLGLEQTLKNSLTTLPMGGAKGGSDFDPKGKSEGEIMRFCQSFINELYRHIGQFTDAPAGDIGVGGREVAYMFGQYKRLTGNYEGAFTGKGLSFGGSLLRPEATGYGLCYFVSEMLEGRGGLEGKTVVISGSGNVAIYACEKATALGAKVVAMSDSAGYIYDPEGIDLSIVKDIKLKRRGRISEYKDGSFFHEGSAGIWTLKCDVALPCATQNELPLEGAKALIANGVVAVAEGANMPTTPEAAAALQEAGVLYAPGKASNAGGVAVSGLEMSQNSLRLSWTADEVDARLKQIMASIHTSVCSAAAACGEPGNYVLGANIAGFLRVAEAMMAQGIV